MDGFNEVWMLRGECGAWSPVFVSMYVVGNFATFLAYGYIGALLILNSSVGINFKSFMLSPSFAAFIALCGLSHLMDGVLAFVLRDPFGIAWYHVLAVLHFALALVSWWAASHLSHAIRKAREYAGQKR